MSNPQGANNHVRSPQGGGSDRILVATDGGGSHHPFTATVISRADRRRPTSSLASRTLDVLVYGATGHPKPGPRPRPNTPGACEACTYVGCAIYVEACRLYDDDNGAGPDPDHHNRPDDDRSGRPADDDLHHDPTA